MVIFFFEEIKMGYINSGNGNSSVQGVPKNPPQKTICQTNYLQ